MDSRTLAAIAGSRLAGLSRPLLDDLLDGARLHDVAAGVRIHREGDDVVHVELVVEGLTRVYVTAPDGRTMTVRYCRTGAMMGVLSLYVTPFVMPATTQAVVDTVLLLVRPATVRRLADSDARVAKALLLEVSDRAAAFVAEIGRSAFSTVRQRIARHLLDLAVERQQGADLVASISQQALADAAGTVREVVVRTLREMRHDGLIRTGRAGIAIDEPQRLLAEAYSEWNTSP